MASLGLEKQLWEVGVAGALLESQPQLGLVGLPAATSTHSPVRRAWWDKRQ